jgi:hypothetical protein
MKISILKMRVDGSANSPPTLTQVTRTDLMAQATSNITTLPIDKAPRKHRRTRPLEAKAPRTNSARAKLAIASATSIGIVAIGATALSLSDLPDSIGEVAHVALWKSYALAIALDMNFVATESFSLFASAAVARATHKATTATKAITLVMSAVANSWAMARREWRRHASGMCCRRVQRAGADRLGHLHPRQGDTELTKPRAGNRPPQP